MNIKQLAAMAIMAGGTACANFQPVDAQTVEDFRVDTDYGYQIGGEISWTDQAQRRHPGRRPRLRVRSPGSPCLLHGGPL